MDIFSKRKASYRAATRHASSQNCKNSTIFDRSRELRTKKIEQRKQLFLLRRSILESKRNILCLWALEMFR